jgi:malate synthase
MHAYTELLVQTTHKRGAFAMGGMAAFIPNRRDPEITENALAKVREDKSREAGSGFDGTWVAHPDLVDVATAEFDKVLTGPNQISRQRPDVSVDAAQLLSVPDTPGEITEDGIRQNVSVGIQYLAAWLNGTGAAAIYNLMEDVATAEISRSQLWQWVQHGRTDRDRVQAIADEEVAALPETPRLNEARQVFEQVALADEFVDFLTLPAYELL